MDSIIDFNVINFLICKKRDCRKRRGERCLKFNASVFVAFGGPCNRGYYGEFKKMWRDVLKVK